MKMPEIAERDGGVRVIYVEPSFLIVEIEKERNRRARKEKRQIEQANTRTTTDVAISVDEKPKGDAERVSAANILEASQSDDTNEQRPTQPERLINNVDAEETLEAVKISTRAPDIVLEAEDYEPDSAADLRLAKAVGTVAVTTATEEPVAEFSPWTTYEAEQTKVKVETMLSVQGADKLQNRIESVADADMEADAATASPNDQATTTAPAENPSVSSKAPTDVVQLSKGVLDVIPRSENATKVIKRWLSPANADGVDEDEDEDEDDWTHISNESREEDAQTAQVAAGSMISRYIFGWGR